jgi:hypothetical protein
MMHNSLTPTSLEAPWSPGSSSANKNKKNEEVKNIETDDEDTALEESRPESPTEGGGDKVNQERVGEER